MTRRERLISFLSQGPSLTVVLVVAFVLRILGLLAIEYIAGKRDKLCLFGDTPIYWEYAKCLVKGTPYVVYQWDVPHYALRTPGYPVWLAGWIAIFGELTWPVRLGQVILGTLGVFWVHRLARSINIEETPARYAAMLAAVDPFQILNSSLLLTESVFTPLLAGFILLWIRILSGNSPSDSRQKNFHFLFFFGAMQAVLALIRPSWGPFLIILIPMLLVNSGPNLREKLRTSVVQILFLLIGWSMVMAPWAIRNINVIGRPALGGTWGGASLYDGVRPGATGGSDMTFVVDPQFRDLAETEQDDLWKQLSFKEIRQDPARIVTLAVPKFKRFWSAWPVDSSGKNVFIKIGGALVTWPVWIFCVIGLVAQPKINRFKNLIILSPLCFTMLEHLIFVGSSRYRIAVFLPLFIYAGHGLWIFVKYFGRGDK